jgi:hypothetical protein
VAVTGSDFRSISNMSRARRLHTFDTPRDASLGINEITRLKTLTAHSETL